jgi:hypothetical protein
LATFSKRHQLFGESVNNFWIKDNKAYFIFSCFSFNS